MKKYKKHSNAARAQVFEAMSILTGRSQLQVQRDQFRREFFIRRIMEIYDELMLDEMCIHQFTALVQVLVHVVLNQDPPRTRSDAALEKYYFEEIEKEVAMLIEFQQEHHEQEESVIH